MQQYDPHDPHDTPIPHDPHCVIIPSILYVGTPVVLVSTCNPDGSPNLAPMSSAWALGQYMALGLGAEGQTPIISRAPGNVFSISHQQNSGMQSSGLATNGQITRSCT